MQRVHKAELGIIFSKFVLRDFAFLIYLDVRVLQIQICLYRFKRINPKLINNTVMKNNLFLYYVLHTLIHPTENFK